MALYYGTELPYSAIKRVCQLKLHGDLFKVCHISISIFGGGKREIFSENMNNLHVRNELRGTNVVMERCCRSTGTRTAHI